MRIIRGKYKGKKIIPPKRFKARPTTDFAKEALFNILQNNYDLLNAEVLDLFAGTGSISFEFLSEGCRNVTSVDISKHYTSHIEKQADELFPGQLTVVCTDVFRFCRNQNLNFNFIFADPPYSDEKLETIPDIIFNNSTLKDTVIVILEHPKIYNFAGHPNFKESRKYGNVNFSFFEKK
ncbi:MAG: methyltransferase domain-containing protein [Chlorobi bacterium]|nr:methyltransferase domain-containing protein [Chlorobiota bacterium]